ncbi:MAG TPA: D-sedoheptulose 7-phosphate isomerase [Vicinamibacterales bacterium]
MTTADRQRLLDEAFADTIAAHGRVRRESCATILAAADALVTALRAGRKVLVCGNGGSAADSQHFVAELVGRFARERRAWPALALTADTSVLTAIGNDHGFARVFARQVEAHGQPGDVLIGISTSGGSPDVLAAVETAGARGLVTIGLTARDGGALGRAADIHLNVPSPSTARAQEVHITILHVLCELVEQELADTDA